MLQNVRLLSVWVLKSIGLIAGGDNAIRKAVEFAEDDRHQAWKDLQVYNISEKDFLIGMAASGRTPYVIGGLKIAQENGIRPLVLHAILIRSGGGFGVILLKCL